MFNDLFNNFVQTQQQIDHCTVTWIFSSTLWNKGITFPFLQVFGIISILHDFSKISERDYFININSQKHK